MDNPNKCCNQDCNQGRACKLEEKHTSISTLLFIVIILTALLVTGVAFSAILEVYHAFSR